MARPSKSVNTMSKNLTKEEIRIRKETEQKLKGNSNKIKPPTYLSKEAKKIFRYIVRELEASNILSNLDIYILSSCSIALDRIQEAEIRLNADLYDKDALKIKESYTKDFFRCCNELSLSPQSRAKIGNIKFNNEQKKEDPLLNLLGGKK